jgi:hypothetical protein
MLLKHMVDTDAKDDDGRTALHWPSRVKTILWLADLNQALVKSSKLILR